MNVTNRFLHIAAVAALSSCAVTEVKQELSSNVQKQGEIYAQEIAAQSPFKKVVLTWNDANQLMKERNLKYRKAIISAETATHKKSLVKSFSSEVKTSLTKTVKQSLDPKQLGKAFKDPIAAIPNQLKSLSDIKNVSHAMTQNEWGKVVDEVGALAQMRKEKVKLHVLFCQQQILDQHASKIRQFEKLLDTDETVKKDSKLVKLIKKAKQQYEKDKELWLNNVRDFFDAEYYDVEFKKYPYNLSHYRNVENPNFQNWRRWRLLDHSRQLATKLKQKHSKEKPLLPGVNTLKTKLHIAPSESAFVVADQFDPSMRSEVRMLIKNWRQLKQIQHEIVKIEEEKSHEKALTVAALNKANKIYTLKRDELKKLSTFWLNDEQCWN